MLNNGSNPYLQFQWELEGIPYDRKICSERVLFQHETYNFVCELKNGTEVTLLVVSAPFGSWTDITRIVCTVDKVFCCAMSRDGQSKTLWKFVFDVNVDRSCTLSFRVSLSETVCHYQHQLVDSLLGVHLWDAAQSRLLTDIEFSVEGKLIPAHQAVLAARCPALSRDKLIDSDVSVASFCTLLQFIYTGQLDKTPNNQLSRLAEKYQLSTLHSLCRIASDDDQGNRKPLPVFGYELISSLSVSSIETEDE